MSDELKLEQLLRTKSVKIKTASKSPLATSIDMPANAFLIVALAVISLGTIALIWILAFSNY